MSTRTTVAAGFWQEKIEPAQTQLLELEKWFRGHGISVDMANGVGGRIGSYKRLRKTLLLFPNDSYYSLYGGMDINRSRYLEDCWEAFAGITQTDAMLVKASETSIRPLFEELLEMSFSSRFVIAYERKGERFNDAQLSDMGLCSSRMTNVVSAATIAWGNHLRSGKLGTKLRNVYQWNAFRPGSIMVGGKALEDWVDEKECGRLAQDSATGLIIWECDDGDALRAKKLLEGTGVLVSQDD